jgi:hypothetical protein
MPPVCRAESDTPSRRTAFGNGIDFSSSAIEARSRSARLILFARPKPGPSGPGQGASLVFDISSDDSDGRTAAGGGKVTWTPEVAAP